MRGRNIRPGPKVSMGGGSIPARRGWLLIAAAALWLGACAGSSESVREPERPALSGDLVSPETLVPVEEMPPGEEAAGGPEEPAAVPGEEAGWPEGGAAFPDEGPAALLPPDMEEDGDGDLSLLEPHIDLAEAAGEPEAPPEEAAGLALPEPAVPPLPEVPAGLPAVAGEPPESMPEESGAPLPEAAGPPPPVPAPAEPAPTEAAPAELVQAEAVPARELPPAPPSFIRPGEEAPSPQAAAPSRPLMPELPARAPPVEPEERGISFSRVVRATVGQLVEVPFRGTGWVYLGEIGSRPGIAYSSRRLDSEGQSFVFRVEAAGTYGLKFYRQDFIRDYIVNDYVQVIAGEPPEAAVTGWFNPSIDRGRVVAEPRWPSALEEAEALSREAGLGNVPGDGGAAGPGIPGRGGAAANPAASGAAGRPPEREAASGAAEPAGPREGAAASPAASGAAGQPPERGTAPVAGPGVPAPRPALSDEGVVPVPAAAIAGTPPALGDPAEPAGLPAQGDLPPGGYLERARQEFDAGRVATALAVLDQFRERYPAGSDEAWWLYGQCYEASGPSRDVRAALDYYRRLVREYPQSRRYNEARRRIAYLERYYINIR